MELRFSKWGGGAHWVCSVPWLASDSGGHWYDVPVGTHFERPGAQAIWPARSVIFVPEDKAYVATLNGPGHDSLSVYVDITTVPVVTSSLVTAVDLDLDVIRRLDGSVYVDDEDEFLEHQLALSYPQDVIDLALASCTTVLDAVTRGLPPYDEATNDRWFGTA